MILIALLSCRQKNAAESHKDSRKNHRLLTALVADLAGSCYLSRAKNITKDTTHPGQHFFELLPSERHYRTAKTHTTRLKDWLFFLQPLNHWINNNSCLSSSQSCYILTMLHYAALYSWILLVFMMLCWYFIFILCLWCILMIHQWSCHC